MTSQTSRRTLLTGTAAAALSGLAGCSTLTGSGSGTTTTASALTDTKVRASTAETGYGIDLSANPVLGSSDAPVDVYYWTDYQCPFCGRFEENAFPKLLENHVAAGEIRLVLLQFPNIGEASTTAARLDKCVWRQVKESNPGAYLDWHAAVFDAQEKPNSGWATMPNLIDIGNDIDGLDAEVATDCRKNETEWAKSAVGDDVSAGTDSGISATPGFVLYNTESDKAGRIVGAQPYERFESAIEQVKNA
ncbi:MULTISPECIES: DsbA family protein [Halorussus]|uniref:DsbA family protein n=1 Tax=Halorussus TaxID=1070314 RepID=UPI000E217904|nr:MULTISPECIES: DsbA family protein [Halorussus]NHN58484.1 DsbA family protein [Halorussus sp. JP-T4]